ncbi:MAG: NADH-quinone oxidoreductase subunit [Actinomycetota bacterium]|jgi:NADH-quinone oxidoreductase subunit C|nr:NADH-quinone oxidoreductase subunit [Actinomycetota bacterium]
MADTEAEPEAEPEPAPPARLHGALLSESRGQTVVHPHRSEYRDLVRALKDEGFVMCVDLTGADYLVKANRPLPEGVVPERFEVVVNLLSLAERRRVRVRVQVPESDPGLPSIYELHPGSEAMERETYDMFGIVFDGHPDLSRILMPDDWEGHPLRKDYGIGRIPVQFKHPSGAQ